MSRSVCGCMFMHLHVCERTPSLSLLSLMGLSTRGSLGRGNLSLCGQVYALFAPFAWLTKGSYILCFKLIEHPKIPRSTVSVYPGWHRAPTLCVRACISVHAFVCVCTCICASMCMHLYVCVCTCGEGASNIVLSQDPNTP